jgi:AmpD protein
VPSPNRDDRPAGVDPTLLVIHSISLPPGVFGGAAIVALFTNTLDPGGHPYFAALDGLRVSAHFLVRRDGALIQFVSCECRAWHAGVSIFEGRERCNDFSIGIELEGDDFTPFEPSQYETLVALIDALQVRYRLTAIAGHDEIAPGRKTDPGPYFDWDRVLAQVSVSLRRP